ncbi:MAG: DUF4276 family protein [Pasteurella sp.]|nr:DUF4276 family protein [Pasteurella sp.]
MTQLVFFLEEPSAREMLKGLLPKILPKNISCQYVVFEGKQDLEKRLPIRLRAWQDPTAKFIVMRDKDSGDCIEIKNNLRQKCINAGHPDVLIRIACHELESFYLGDLKAVEQAFKIKKLSLQQRRSKFRNPDYLGNPAQELKKLVPSYQKVSGSRIIGPLLDVENNCSTSFKVLVSGIKTILHQ